MPEIIQQFSKQEECIFIKGGKSLNISQFQKKCSLLSLQKPLRPDQGDHIPPQPPLFSFLEQAMCSSTDAVLAAEPEPAGVVPSHTAFLHVCGCCRECSLWQASNHLLFSTLLISFHGIFLAWSYVTTEVSNSLMKIKAVLGFYRCGTQPKT